MLITGGGNEEENILSSVEVFDPSGMTCVVSDLSRPRAGHAIAGHTVCGDDTCETLHDDGHWRLSHTLQKNRTGLGLWTDAASQDTFVLGRRNRDGTNTLITEMLRWSSAQDLGTSFKRWSLQEERPSYGFR